MKIIDRYLTTTVISSILLILLILMGMELLITFIGQLSDIGRGNYGLWAAVKYVFLDMPYQLYNFFPMAGLVGTLLGLGILANQSELIVIRATGYSTFQISFVVLKASLLLVLCGALLGEGIAPYTEYLAKVEKAYAKSSGKALSTAEGMWLREGNSFIHVRKIVSKEHLEDVTSYQFNQNHQLQMAMNAAQANYQQGIWTLVDVNQSYFVKDQVAAKHIDTMTWQVKLDPTLLKISESEPSNMSLTHLKKYINYLKTNNLQTTLYELNYWNRIFTPFATIVMIFLAIPFVFGSMRNVTMGVRIFTGIIVGFAFFILKQFFGPLSLLLQIPPFIGAALPTMMFVFLGIYLMLRVR